MTWVDALIGAFGLIIVALIQKDRSEGRTRRVMDSRDHAHLVQKIDYMGRTLGMSVDRVERNLGDQLDMLNDRVATLSDRVDEHIRDHATGAFLEIDRKI
jgi:hypothetical protein